MVSFDVTSTFMFSIFHEIGINLYAPAKLLNALRYDNYLSIELKKKLFTFSNEFVFHPNLVKYNPECIFSPIVEGFSVNLPLQ